MPYMSRREAERFFGPYFHDLYRAVVRGAQGDYQAEYSEKAKLVQDASCRAHCRNCHMRDRLIELSVANPEKMHVFRHEGLIGIVIEQKAAVLAKKLDPDLRTRNNMTPHFERYLRQKNIAGIDALHNFVVGYTEDPFSGEVKSVHLVHPKNQFDRYYEFTLTGGDAASSVIELFPDAPVEPPTISTVEPLHKPEDDVEAPPITDRKKPADVVEFKKPEEKPKK